MRIAVSLGLIALLVSILFAVNKFHSSPAKAANPTTAAEPSSSSVSPATQWQHYRERSAQLRARDLELLTQELAQLKLQAPLVPEHTKEFGFETRQSADWFKTEEGQKIMANILSFQTPSGGWSKRTDMTHQREPGMMFGSEKNYIPTFDNNATSTQMILLAQAFAATGAEEYQAAFARGLTLILNAQYPNGGWPQNYPLVGGYHDLITYNDKLMVNLMSLLKNIADAKGIYQFVSREQQQLAQASLDKAIDCVLKTQVIQNGQPTIWGAQHDPISLAPAQARAFEMASLSTAESGEMVEFLMKIKKPSAALINSITGAVNWFETHKIAGMTWQRGDQELTPDSSSEGVWARFYELNSNRPVFGDRDGSVHYQLSEISAERINGYAWYTPKPAKAIAKFAAWSQKNSPDQ